MNRTRVIVVAAVAVVVFGGALLLFRGGDDDNGSTSTEAGGTSLPTPTMQHAPPAGGCPGTAKADAAYKVTVPTPPRADADTFDVVVTRDGQPVKEAKVCFSVGMDGMAHTPVGGEATEVSNGTYRFNSKFSMRGSWTGDVTVVPSGGSAVTVPLSLNVS